jgi:LysM repeat protein
MNFQQMPEPKYNFCMTRRIRLVFLVLIFASLLDPARAAPARAESLPKPRLATAYELIDAVNRYRGQNGLAAYAINSILMGTAQNQAEFMASTGTVTHTGPGGISFPDRLRAAGYNFVFRSENIISSSPNTSGWDLVTSPGWADSLHQHTMLSPDLCEVGAGVSVSGALAYYVLDASCPSGSSGTGGFTPVPGATSVGGGGGVATLAIVIPNTSKPDGSVSHLVRPGETLWSIAIAYQTTIAELKVINNLTSDDIYPGDTLQIFLPKATQTPAPTSTGTPYPTATPFVFWTVTSSPEPTASPIPSAPVAGGSGMVIVGVIVVAALVAAGALTAAGARKRPRE